jgi:hypothetical protein
MHREQPGSTLEAEGLAVLGLSLCMVCGHVALWQQQWVLWKLECLGAATMFEHTRVSVLRVHHVFAAGGLLLCVECAEEKTAA